MNNSDFQITIYTKQDLTDKLLLEFISKNENISIKEYTDFLATIKLSNALAESLIKFICEYDNGYFTPDKCDAYEPIKENFDKNFLTSPIKWLSQPGGAFYFKKIKGPKIEGVFDNLQFAPIWSNGKIVSPKIEQPIYKGKLQFIIPLRIAKMKGLKYWIIFIDKIKELAKADLSLFTLLEEFDLYNVESHKKNESILSSAVKDLLSI